MNNRDFNDLFYLNRNLSYHFNQFLNNLFYWLNDFFFDQLFSYHFHLLDDDLLMNNFNNLFNHLRDLNNPFNCFDNWDYLLHNAVHRFVDSFNMIRYFQGFSILNDWHCLFHNFLNNLNCWYFNNSLNNFFLDHRYFHNFFNDLFNRYDFFLHYLHLLDLLLDVIDNSLDFYHFLHLNDFLDGNFHSNNFRHFLCYINYFFNNCWYFNDLVNDLFNRNNLLYYLSLNYRNL